MKKEDRLKLVAPCGIDCGICELHICKDNPQLFDYLLANGIPEEKIPCKGCREIEGDCPALVKKCPTYKCISEKRISFCFECDEFPCTKLQPTADRAETLPHNMKVYNLCSIERDGLDVFVENSNDIKQRYFKGKMLIGDEPQD